VSLRSFLVWVLSSSAHLKNLHLLPSFTLHVEHPQNCLPWLLFSLVTVISLAAAGGVQLRDQHRPTLASQSTPGTSRLRR
jgi:hypothetical protein